MSYGKELILDIECGDPETFCRLVIEEFFIELCNKIDMDRADLHFWDYEEVGGKEEAPDHLSGTSAIQFISTSNITIHTLDKLRSVYLNIFSCKDFDVPTVEDCALTFFGGRIRRSTTLERG